MSFRGQEQGKNKNREEVVLQRSTVFICSLVMQEGIGCYYLISFRLHPPHTFARALHKLVATRFDHAWRTQEKEEVGKHSHVVLRAGVPRFIGESAERSKPWDEIMVATTR
jgi:hypothetical protein